MDELKGKQTNPDDVDRELAYLDDQRKGRKLSSAIQDFCKKTKHGIIKVVVRDHKIKYADFTESKRSKF